MKIDALEVESCIPWIVGEPHLFLCTVHVRDDYIILDLSPHVSENGTSSSIPWNTNRAPSSQQIRPIALLAADAENAADAVQARHMIDLDESCREVENMS